MQEHHPASDEEEDSCSLGTTKKIPLLLETTTKWIYHVATSWEVHLGLRGSWVGNICTPRDVNTSDVGWEEGWVGCHPNVVASSPDHVFRSDHSMLVDMEKGNLYIHHLFFSNHYCSTKLTELLNLQLPSRWELMTSRFKLIYHPHTFKLLENELQSQRCNTLKYAIMFSSCSLSRYVNIVFVDDTPLPEVGGLM